VIVNLQGKKKSDSPTYESPIVVSSQLSPSQTSVFTRFCKRFCYRTRGKTSHTAIIARSLEIPAVIGVKGIVEAVSPGDEIIVDGIDGLVIIKPTEDEKKSILTNLRHSKREDQTS